MKAWWPSVGSCLGILLILGGLPPALDAHPSHDVTRGLESLAVGRLEDAEAAFQRARFAAPDDPRILYNLGLVSLHKRSYEEAAGLFSRAVALTNDPDLGSAALHNQGNAWYRAGRFQEAVVAYEQSLQRKEEEQTRFNLDRARKKLDEQLQQMAQQQPQQDPNQQNQQQSSPKDGQQQPGQQQNQQQGQQGQQQQGQQSGQQQAGEKPDQNGQQQQPSQDPGQQAQSPNPGQNQEQDKQATRPDGEKDGQTGSGSAGVAEQEGSDTREDLQMAEAGKNPKEPEASQQARAMKNRAINPYMIEKVLRELEQRERELQMHYRNDPQRNDEEGDPFYMNSRQLQDFFQGRRTPKKPKQEDAPDW